MNYIQVINTTPHFKRWLHPLIPTHLSSCREKDTHLREHPEEKSIGPSEAVRGGPGKKSIAQDGPCWVGVAQASTGPGPGHRRCHRCQSEQPQQ